MALIWLLTAAAVSGYAAQSDRDSSSIAVHVVDPVGADVDGAAIRLRLLPSGFVLSRDTGSDGLMVFPGMRAGRYTITVAKTGFSAIDREVSVGIGESASVVVSLPVQGIRDSVHVVGTLPSDGVTREFNGRARLEDTQGVALYAGKKNEVIVLDRLDANLAIGNTRQVFAKVPGTNIWEIDSSGLQVGISNRGLDPNRSWEMNSRQNGYDITADIFGYPEAYFTPPLEAVERIEVVRGASSLQYGAQFGGLVNYVLKKAPANRRVSFATEQTVGQNGLFNSHNSVGGQVGKWSYNGYFHHRQGDGWRPSGGFDNNSAFGSVEYAVNERLKVGVEITGLHSLVQMAGGLTDDLFRQNARQSIRPRNWFSLNWILPSVKVEYAIDASTQLSVKATVIEGHRLSLFNGDPVGLPSGAPNLDDPRNPRTLYDDHFHNRAVEARVLRQYQLGGAAHSVAAGFRYYHGRTSRQHGIGVPGSEATFDLLVPRLDRDLLFKNVNLAGFVENAFRLTPRLTVTPGVRLDYINGTGEGRPIIGKETRNRLIPLAGVGASYRLPGENSLYGNITQAYRATLFNDLWRPDPTIIIDPDLRDMTGYVSDFGWRGARGHWLSFDIGGFYLKYGNRLGLLNRLEANGTTNVLWTNISDSRNIGVESFVEADLLRLIRGDRATSSLYVFSSVATANTRYLGGSVRGNRVELAPDAIARWGLTYRRGTMSGTIQHGYVGDQFADAGNTLFKADASQGLIPSYQVWDVTASREIRKDIVARIGINNLTDARYFTRRATSYPGPGLIPGDGRSVQVSLGWRR